MTSRFGRDRWHIIFLLLIVAMGIEIGYLMYQNHKLRSIIDDPKQYFQTLSPDETVPAITAEDINGNEVQLRYSTQAPHTVLFWFAPDCSSCQDNLDFWNQLTVDLASDQLRFLGMCAGAPQAARQYADQYDLKFPVVCADNDFLITTYKGNVLPQTVVISPTGRIIDVWPGSLNSERETEIRTLLQGFKS